MFYHIPDIWIMSMIASKSLMELFAYLGFFGEFLRVFLSAGMVIAIWDNLEENKK